MKKELDRCMGCMSEKLYEGPCEICGYTPEDKNPPDCLQTGTLLAERYVLGRVISRGGEGSVYIAFDTKLGLTVEIKEFMPDTLCTRGEDGEAVVVNDGALPLFKSYLSEFADLHKSMMSSIECGGLKKTFDIFAANGTGYVVNEHIAGVSLEEYLEKHGGKLSWGEASRLFPPLFDTVSALHEKGIVHRGLCPAAICVTPDAHLVLTSVEISEAKTADSQLTSEMADGYAASEQYDLSERQGNWTDVYAVSAVLYRALTGITPPAAPARKADDTLVPAHTVNDDVPAYVSDAIADGMRVSRTDRLHDMKTLRARLYDAPADIGGNGSGDDESDGPITPTVHVKFDVEEREEQRIKAAKSKKKKAEERKNVGTAVGLFVFFAMVIALVICIIYFSKESQNIEEGTVTARSEQTVETEPAETTTRPIPTTSEEPKPVEDAGEKLMVPSFINRFFNTSLKSRYSMLVFETEEEYSDEYSEGIIFEQDIPEGTMVNEGTTIHIKVSKGAAFTYLPDYIGMKLSDYTNKLTTLGVRFEAEAEETSEVKAGYVVRCSKEIGDKVYISENELVTVYYAVKPAKTTAAAPETEPEEEVPAEEDDDNEEEEVIGED